MVIKLTSATRPSDLQSLNFSLTLGPSHLSNFRSLWQFHIYIYRHTFIKKELVKIKVHEHHTLKEQEHGSLIASVVLLV